MLLWVNYSSFIFVGVEERERDQGQPLGVLSAPQSRGFSTKVSIFFGVPEERKNPDLREIKRV